MINEIQLTEEEVKKWQDNKNKEAASEEVVKSVIAAAIEQVAEIRKEGRALWHEMDIKYSLDLENNNWIINPEKGILYRDEESDLDDLLEETINELRG